MRPSIVILLLALSAGCTDFPELEGQESAAIRSAPYPRLIPLEGALVAPVDTTGEAQKIEQDLKRRSEALSQKAQALENTSTE